MSWIKKHDWKIGEEDGQHVFVPYRSLHDCEKEQLEN